METVVALQVKPRYDELERKIANSIAYNLPTDVWDEDRLFTGAATMREIIEENADDPDFKYWNPGDTLDEAKTVLGSEVCRELRIPERDVFSDFSTVAEFAQYLRDTYTDL